MKVCLGDPVKDEKVDEFGAAGPDELELITAVGLALLMRLRHFGSSANVTLLVVRLCCCPTAVTTCLEGSGGCRSSGPPASEECLQLVPEGLFGINTPGWAAR